MTLAYDRARQRFWTERQSYAPAADTRENLMHAGNLKMVVALVAVACALGSCDAGRHPTGPENLSAKIQPMCQLGCQPGGDPNPEAPGIYLEAITPSYCAEGSDSDSDGLANFCEKMLSSAFRPELLYWDQDDVRREPYWAARRVGEDTVRIAYLLSYYIDLGAANWSSCWNSWGWLGLPPFFQDVAKWCNGHNGDSEAIILDVSYDASTHHWVLRRAYLSSHEHYHVASASPEGYPTEVEYPGLLGGYPSVYVSQKKHANYFSRSECNNGGPYVSLIGGEIYTDDCTLVNASARFEWSNWWNIGSNVDSTATRLVDCVESRNPAYEYYGSGRQECIWTPVDFRGWVPDNVGGTSAHPGYRVRLSQFGF